MLPKHRCIIFEIYKESTNYTDYISILVFTSLMRRKAPLPAHCSNLLIELQSVQSAEHTVNLHVWNKHWKQYLTFPVWSSTSQDGDVHKLLCVSYESETWPLAPNAAAEHVCVETQGELCVLL